MVGDRGTIAQKQIEELREIEGMDWITALRPDAIQKLVQRGAIQMGPFDERNLFELSHPDFAGERLVACRNPELALRRAEKRRSLIEATARELERVSPILQQTFSLHFASLQPSSRQDPNHSLAELSTTEIR